MAQPARNNRAERRCPECEGAGAIDIPAHDPQFDSHRRCVTCTGDGWVRWAPTDALEVLAAERRGVLLLKAADSQFLPSARRFHARALATAARRVPLPADRPSLAQLYANLEQALRVAA